VVRKLTEQPVVVLVAGAASIGIARVPDASIDTLDKFIKFSIPHSLCCGDSLNPLVGGSRGVMIIFLTIPRRLCGGEYSFTLPILRCMRQNPEVVTGLNSHVNRFNFNSQRIM